MKLKIRRGATIFDPIPIGRRADGQISSEVVARPTGGVHKLISGMTGSGKSYGEKPTILTCGALQVDQFLLDPVKGIQSYASIAGALQWYVIDPGQCKKVLARLLSHTLPARTNHLAREGLTEWDPRRSTLRFLRVHIEEAWKLANANALVGLGVALRSAGGQLTISLQQPTFDQMPTVLRNQMGAFRCYGLSDRDYNEYSLPEDVIAAGANPAQWGNEDPGMHYCVMPGMTIREKTLPVRAWADGTGENTFADAAAYVAANLGPVCPVTDASLGDLWAGRVAPLDLVAQMGPVVPGVVLRDALDALGEDDEGNTDDDEEDGEPGEEFNDDEVLSDPEYQEALADFADLGGEEVDDSESDITFEEDPDGNITITDSDGEEFVIEAHDPDDDEPDLDELVDGPQDPDVARLIGDPPKDGITREEFRDLIEARVQEFLTGDEEHLRRSSFVKACADCGWSMASVNKQLNRHPQLAKADRGLGWIRVAA